MGSCTRRHFLLSTCLLQMITIIERQVFDFLGYMWAPILVNFFHIIFIILGFYGAYHFRIKYIITYLIWSFIWIGWNAFLICFYLNVGTLDRDSDLLNLGTGSVSWFEANGYGCKPTYPTNITSDDPFRPIRPERVDECLLNYEIVEVVQSAVQCALALLGILGAILISYIFLDEDDRFDFMNGDAKSPQHTVVHPMYVSYSSIPTSTSASATLLSNKHQSSIPHHHNNALNNIHHHHQQHQQHQQQPQQQPPNNPLHMQPNNNNNNNNNNNTFLIHTNSSRHGANQTHSLSQSHSSRRHSNQSGHKLYNNNNNISNSSGGGQTPSASKSNTLTRMLYSPKLGSNKIGSSTNSLVPLNAANTAELLLLQQQRQQQQQQQPAQLYYDDSTAKADQLYTNSNRRQILAATYQQQHATTPNSSHDNTTSSLSYASLQNSNLNLTPSLQGGGGFVGSGGMPGMGSGMCVALPNAPDSNATSPLSNSTYSLTSSINNNNNQGGGGSGQFARIHSKPKTPKSSSYSSFINGSMNGAGGGSGSNLHRPDIKYTQMSSERLSHNLEEGLEDDNFSLQNFKTDDGVTYVPFQKPTPGNLFVGQNNNPSYTSLNSYGGNASPNNNNNSVQAPPFVRSISQTPHINNNTEILLENGAILQPIFNPQPPPPLNNSASYMALSQQALLNPANRFMYQQNGLPFHAMPGYHHPPAAKPPPTRPTNIPLPSIPAHSFDTPISPSEVTPPPPPAPRPHIFQPRSGHAPYPDLSPEVTEKYSMPTQYIPRSPVASRIARRQRQQQQQPQQPAAQPHLNTSANCCDQIRDAPPGYNFDIVRAKSFDRLSSSRSGSVRREAKAAAAAAMVNANVDAAPHVNRRSGRRDASVKHASKHSKHRQSLYSIEFGPSLDTIRSRADTILDYDDHLHERGGDGGELSPKPMTPRRVKRRSVMARGSNSRQSTQSRRSHHGTSSRRGGDKDSHCHGTHSSGRSSMRSSRRKYPQSPVSKLLDQQQLQLQQQQQQLQQQSLHHHQHHQHQHHQQQQAHGKQEFGSFQRKQPSSSAAAAAALTASNLQTLNQEIFKDSTNVMAPVAGGSLTKSNNNNNYHSFRKNIPPDPIYYNTNGQAGLFQQQSWQSTSQSPIVADEPPPTPTSTLAGHYNPSYQHSSTNLHDSEHPDELYNNRPPSVRSSYSNFHGTRPLSSYLPSSGPTENVFVGLTGAAQAPQLPPHPAPSTPPLYQTHPLQQQHEHSASQQHLPPPPPLPSPGYVSSAPQNVAFAKRTASRESIRSMAFLNSGPPAYNLNYHTPPDSETTM